jgi:hypothetical protein
MSGRRVLTGGIAAVALAMAAIVIGPTLGAGASNGNVYFPSKCMNSKIEPNKVILGCADYGFYLDGLSWRDWGSRKARGAGTAHINNCKPSCEQGTFHSYPGKLKLTHRKRCSQDGLRHYTKSRFTFPGHRPHGYPKHFNQKWPCKIYGGGGSY